MIRSLHRGIAVAILGVVAVVAVTAAKRAPESYSAPILAEFEDNWLKGLDGTHRQIFDSPQPVGGIPLVHMMNFMNTYQRAYGVTDAQMNTVGTFYGGTTFHALRDEMWTKYDIHGFLAGLGIDAGTGGSANPWRSAPQILGMTLPDASIESLQARGTRFIVCNNAMGIFATMLASARGLDAADVTADLKANLLPGVELVPAMVIAIGQAQEAGLAYHRQ